MNQVLTLNQTICMSKHFFLIITLAFLIACKGEQKPVAEETPAPKKLDYKEIKAPIPFTGSYLNEAYLAGIREHKSPRKAQEGIDECFIRIPANTLTPTTMVFNFHEAMTGMIPLNNNGTYELWETQNDTLSKMRYTITIVGEDKIKIGDKNFVKINPEFSGSQPLILESILFEGAYVMKKDVKVEFKNNGEVTGLGKYKYYVPVMDYFDAGLQIDQVGLGETRDKLDYYGFKFRKNGLDLFEIKCKTYDDKEKRCVDVDFGKKAFDLTLAKPSGK